MQLDLSERKDAEPQNTVEYKVVLILSPEHLEKRSAELPADILPEEKRSLIFCVREAVRICSLILWPRQLQVQVLRCSICWRKVQSFVTTWKK